MRFDPVDTFAVAELEKIVLENAAGSSEVVLENATSNACFAADHTLYFDTADPQVFLHCSPENLEGLQKVRVYLRYLAIGEPALLLITAELRRRIEELEKDTGKKKHGWQKVLSLLQG